ncbi:MAG: DNA-directed RNA polymerase subunit A' [Candidatus Pacearchaeota archaeon]|nr:MAG: DNA-directed RNA polymerase subunit A' [Candidatus Pacearchaeota archaeon]
MEPIIKQIKEIQFSLFSPEQIKKFGAAKIVTPELYDMDGYPVDGGLMDLRLGAIGPGVRCRTCGGLLKECLGHFGYIELARPVLHIKFLPLIYLCLKATCQECGRILLTEEYIKLKRVDKARTAKKCPYCGTKQEKVKLDKPSSFYIGKKRIFPTEIRERLVRISDSDARVLGINPKSCRPEWAILTLLLVPPVTVRPSITLETGERSEDDLTHKLSDIVRANQRLWENLNAGAPEVIIEDLWDLLQYHSTTFFDNTISHVPPARHRSGQPLKTITERIKGKQGRIRHNLAGKRVNFSSRTIISPDPYIEINDVGVPLEIAKVLTVPERITTSNMGLLSKKIEKTIYPAANSIIRLDGKRKRITEELREQLKEELDIGYLVERHLEDNDIVLFNRHPSLHRMSLMGHFVKVLPGRTFRIHPAATFPYNADFDGDAMNIHVPQTEEARAEAKVLLDVANHLISPKINANVLGCVEDAITGLYLLTSAKNIPREEAIQLLSACGTNIKNIHFKEKVYGREIFSALLPKINFETKSKACKGRGCPYFERCKKENCPYNAYVAIKNGKLISGLIDEKIIGVETNTLTRELDRQAGRKRTIDFLKRVFLLGVLYLTRKGFTISIADIETTDKVKEETKEIIKGAEKKVQKIIASFYDNTLEIIPGKTFEESREIKILQTLNEVRTKVGDSVKKELKKDNPAYIMAVCGSRGSLLFLTQMASTVGQQSLWAKRINFGYNNRTLSFYKERDFAARAGGFIYSNYLNGLKADEFFFTAVTGRDGLMDTALRTPKSGYLYRRLVNALQDLRVEYDGTVRDSNANIIQFEYGEDGIDITKEHLEDNKIAPGEAIGVITAESFGEPATQMTLNVFHFAGVSEMQITVGLPRLIEIFDARKKPSTPSMEIYLERQHNNSGAAKRIAAKIREIKLNDITEEIQVNFSESKINIKLNKKSLRELHLSKEKIISALESKYIRIKKTDEGLSIKPKEEEDFKGLYKIKEKLKETNVAGVKGISQILIVKRDSDYIILTAGSNLEDIFKIKGIDKNKVITNNIYEIYNVLGIEAARQAIINEAKKVIEKQSLAINDKHIKLVADAMTSSGSVKGVTRVGIISDKSSILARASFETPIKHFVNASITASTDHLVSVIENLILNQPVPVGTGLPGLLVKITKQEDLARK